MGNLINQTVSMVSGLTSMMGPTLTTNSTSSIKSDSMEIGFKKASLETLKEPIKLDQGGITGPDFSEVGEGGNGTNATTLVQQAVVLTSAMAGNNSGADGASIGESASVGLSYLDADGQEIRCKNLTKPVDVWIKRSANLKMQEYSLINVDSLPSKNRLITYKFNLGGTKVSTHIQLKPSMIWQPTDFGTDSNDTTTEQSTAEPTTTQQQQQTTTSELDANMTTEAPVATEVGYTPLWNMPAYLFVLKWGSIASVDDYDEWQIICPSDAVLEYGEDIYVFFMNINKTGEYKGSVGIGFRELNINETDDYCTQNQRVNMTEPPTDTNFMNRHNVSLRIYSSGCFYIDPDSGNWLTDGMEVLEDTNVTFTHCESTHLTSFAGGFVALPPKIDFSAAFAKAGNFLENLTINITLMAFVALYVVCALTARYYDNKDKKKMGLIFLDKKIESERYYYQMDVFTGARPNSDTTSKVSGFERLVICLFTR